MRCVDADIICCSNNCSLLLDVSSAFEDDSRRLDDGASAAAAVGMDGSFRNANIAGRISAAAAMAAVKIMTGCIFV